MFESFIAVPAHFAVEFCGFLVFAAGAVLAFTRADLVRGEPSNRLTVAVGFAALAAAQVLHGGSFADAQTDGAQILIGLKTLGLAFVVFGVVGSLRATTTAAALVLGTEPLLFAPAAAALVLFLAAAAGARSKESRSLWGLALFALFLGASDLLTSGAPDAKIGTLTVAGAVYAAHGLKVLAYVALGSWFWSAVRASIRIRFVASFAVLLVAIVLALSTSLSGVISSNVEVEELDQVAGQLRSAATEIETEATREVRGLAETIATLEDSIERGLVGGGDAQGLAESVYAEPTFELENGFVMLMDRRGGILGFAGRGPHRNKNGRPRPTELRDIDVVTINGSAVIDQVARGAVQAASPDRLGRNLLAVIAAHEVNHPDRPAVRVGIVALGRWIDALTVEGISERLRLAASLIVDDKTIASELPRPVPKRGLIPSGLRSQVRACTPVTDQIALRGLASFTAFRCLRNDANVAIATLALSSPARNVIQTTGIFTRILFLIAMGVGAVSLVLAWLSGRAITRPIQELTAAATAVREGDLAVQAPVHGEDEVGQLGDTFNEMTASLFRMTNDLRQAARQEHDLRARIETIVESMADGLVAVDANRKVLAFNPAAEEITGVRAQDAVDRDVQDVLDARDSQGTKVTLPIFDLVRGSVDGVFLARKNGDPIPVAVVSALLPAVEGGPSGGVAVLRDMSREREVERMKSEFLSNISHELRTPLTPIKGYAEILGRKGLPPEKAQKFASGILESTARLERIVHLLVDFSAMEAGRLAPKTKSIDIASIVNSVGEEWAGRTSQHSIVMEVNPTLPHVLGDERLLRRTLEEVLDNAVKFSPQGGTIRVEARLTNGEGQPDDVQISVSDEGIGISAQDMGKIFSDFRQLDGSETRAYGGLGLGLAFVQRIVEAHDGSVAVDSHPEEGTRLTITIPASAGADPSGSVD